MRSVAALGQISLISANSSLPDRPGITTSLSNNDSYSAFGQLRWKITPDLELAGGARYTHDVKKVTQLTLANNPLQQAAFGLFLY